MYPACNHRFPGPLAPSGKRLLSTRMLCWQETWISKGSRVMRPSSLCISHRISIPNCLCFSRLTSFPSLALHVLPQDLIVHAPISTRRSFHGLSWIILLARSSSLALLHGPGYLFAQMKNTCLDRGGGLQRECIYAKHVAKGVRGLD